MQQLLGAGSAAAGTLPPTETCQDSGLEMLVAVTALPNEVCDRGDATGADRVAWRSVWGAGAAPRKEGTWLRHSHKDRAQQEAAIPLSYPTPVGPSCPAGHQHRPGPPAPRANTVADEGSRSSFPRYPGKEILRFSGMPTALGARCSAEQPQLPCRAARRQHSLLSHCQQLLGQLPELTARQRRAPGTSHSHFLPNISTVSKSPSF